ncbi:MAG: response regulator with a DNA-binding domain [Bacteroidetes bacterium]|nr:response regulator with a DNA-binding domain [Bacteroidota bacterium]
MKLNIIIVDDHTVVRKGLKQILADEMMNVQTSEAGSAEELLQKIRNQKFDLVITDISMPGRSGIDLIKQLHIDYPDLPVLILSMHSETQYALRAITAGASGYLTKEMASHELVRAVRQILNGRKYISPMLAELLADNASGRKVGTSYQALSDREIEVLLRIARGRRVSEIAADLSLSINTINTYRARILEKLSLHNNAELTRYAIDNNLE